MRKSEDQNQPAVRYSESREGAERMRIRSYVSALVRFGLLALVLPLNNAVGSTAPAKKPISEDEFLREFKANREISNRTVPARAIIEALHWVQQAVKRKEKNIPDSLSLENCVVEGAFTFYENLEWWETPQKHNDDKAIKTLLDETSINELPNELSENFRKAYVDAGIQKVIVLPIQLSFTSVQFTSDSDFVFVNTVFEGTVTFDTCVFDSAYVRFEDSTFMVRALFESNTFGSEVTFLGATFQELASFSASTFKAAATFDNVNFQDDANFGSYVGSPIRFGGYLSFRQAILEQDVEFTYAKFDAEVDFTEAEVHGNIVFQSSKLGGNAFLTNLNKTRKATGTLVFFDTTFSERAYFNDSKIHQISFSGVDPDERSDSQASIGRVSAPVIFHRRASFTNLTCDRADFIQVEFQDFADFTGAQFLAYSDFSNATFEGGATFYLASFPRVVYSSASATGVSLERVQFLKGVALEWKQLNGNLRGKNPDTLQRLENAFRQNGDLESQNEAMYRRESVQGQQAGRVRRTLSEIDRAFWGFGVRPSRVFGWMLVVSAFFTAVYWTQTRELIVPHSRLESFRRRLAFSVTFSLRTAWAWTFGFNNSRTTTFKIITVVHSLVFKILLLFLLQAFANTSPLLNQLAGKLIHV
jgi:uncharacterized protein YjbI with pentapeptide repeats